MQAKALDLFQAYGSNQLPKDGGFIVSSFLDDTSTYSKFEVIAYNAVKSLYFSDDGLTFQSEGNKLFVLVEPSTYPKKFIEPFRRHKAESIPQRFSELNIFSTKNVKKSLTKSYCCMYFPLFK